MVDVLDRVALRTSQDILAALPALPVEPFSTRELAALLGCGTLLAQRTLYCLRTIGSSSRRASAAPRRFTCSRAD